MKLQSPLSNEIESLLRKQTPSRSVTAISELYKEGGTNVVFGVDRLWIKCIAGPLDLTVAVKSEDDREWAAISYLYLFFEKPNIPDALESMFNSKRQIVWLAENFDSVYALFCDTGMQTKKKEFEVFQNRTHRERLKLRR
jgi:hypothetical protein